MVLKELADKDGLSVLVSDNTAATGARSRRTTKVQIRFFWESKSSYQRA
jgi:hypothetical protein